MAQRTHKTLVYSIRVSQRSVTTRFRCGGIFNDNFLANLLGTLPVNEF